MLRIFLALVLAAEVRGYSLWEAYGDAEAYREVVKPVEGSRRKFSPMAEKAYKVVRSTTNCTYPLEVLLVQDTTASFSEDFAAMRDTQLRLMYEGIERHHPNSRYGILTFQDKPMWPLGQDFNYCVKFNVPLTNNFTAVEDEYGHLPSLSGGDMPENQYGALFASVHSPTVGWDANTESIATRLIILITDAQPHFADDGFNEFNLRPFENKWSDADEEDICKNQYYPAPEHVKNALHRVGAYTAFLVFDDGANNAIVSKSWKWFNTFIGQDELFVADLFHDSSNFWAQMEAILDKIDSIECQNPCHPGRLIKEKTIRGTSVRVVAQDSNNDLTDNDVLELCQVLI